MVGGSNSISLDTSKNFHDGHDNVIKWKYFHRNLLFVSGIHRLPVDSAHKGQWHRALMLSLICAWTNGRANNRNAGDLRRHRAHYGVTVISDLCASVFIISTIRADVLEISKYCFDDIQWWASYIIKHKSFTWLRTTPVFTVNVLT